MFCVCDVSMNVVWVELYVGSVLRVFVCVVVDVVFIECLSVVSREFARSSFKRVVARVVEDLVLFVCCVCVFVCVGWMVVIIIVWDVFLLLF